VALGGGYSSSVNAAVAALVSGNKFVAVHAGNDASNVGNYSPASEPSACTVGGTAADDSVSSASNTGALLDIWAPGQSILTTYLNGGTVSLQYLNDDQNVLSVIYNLLTYQTGNSFRITGSSSRCWARRLHCVAGRYQSILALRLASGTINQECAHWCTTWDCQLSCL
jgi:hypothetical protein